MVAPSAAVFTLSWRLALDLLARDPRKPVLVPAAIGLCSGSRPSSPATARNSAPPNIWRHYNSLYFPYVVGVRAYAQNATAAGLDATARQAWQWLVTEVPQRSLHNWQNAAARLIAAGWSSRHSPIRCRR